MNFFVTKFAATKSLGKSALSFARLQQMTRIENVSFSDGLRDCEDPECCENKDCQSNQVGSKDGNNWESESLSQTKESEGFYLWWDQIAFITEKVKVID